MLCSFTWIVRFKNDGGLVRLCFKMPVQAIFSYIQFSTQKPFYFRSVKVVFQHLIPWHVPLKIFSNIRPKGLWIIVCKLFCLLIGIRCAVSQIFHSLKFRIKLLNSINKTRKLVCYKKQERISVSIDTVMRSRKKITA
ncbi:MAG: Uncharacterised protein [Bacteroidota bacterium]|nr:MAG: Uncharacterised protein [Bacteroidota bacterium]